MARDHHRPADAAQQLVERIPRQAASAILLALTLLALALRISGVDSMVPHRMIVDEEVYVKHLQLMRGDARDAGRDAGFGLYPHLVPRIALALSGDAPAEPPRTMAEHVARAAPDLLLLRRTVALLSVLVVPLTYLVARRFLDRAASLAAAALAATSLLGVWFGSIAKPHGPATALMCGVILGALEIRRRGDARAYLVAGAAAGLALGTLQTAVFVLPAILVAHLLRPRDGSRLAFLWLCAALLLAAAGVRIFQPYLFVSAEGIDHPAFAPLRLFSEMFQGHGLRRALDAAWNWDPLLFGCAALGSLLWVRDVLVSGDSARRLDLVVLTSFALPYLIVLALYYDTTQRYLMPLVPLAAVAAAHAVFRAGRALTSVTGSPPAWAALPAVLLLGAQGFAVVRVASLRARDDTCEQAARWIEEHLDPSRDSLAIVPSVDLPLLREERSLRWNPSILDNVFDPWIRYQVQAASAETASPRWSIRSMAFGGDESMAEIATDPRSFLDGLDAEYLVLEILDRPVLREIIGEARSRGELVARFAPYLRDPADERPVLYGTLREERTAAGPWVWSLMRAERMGNVLEIYRWR